MIPFKARTDEFPRRLPATRKSLIQPGFRVMFGFCPDGRRSRHQQERALTPEAAGALHAPNLCPVSHAIFAVAFHVVHGAVRLLDQNRSVCRVIGEKTNADAGCN